MIPDRSQCIELLEEAGTPEDVIEHAVAVEALASAMAAKTGVDRSIVAAGALLHDVGRAFTHDVDHVPRGAAFLEDQGVDERVVDCVARHMGAGIDDEQADAFGWPENVYEPQLIREKIVSHADNLTHGVDYVDLAAVLDKLEDGGLEHVVPPMRRLHGELRDVLGEDPAEITRTLA
jgi:uncharacterized protein (TIGR00295 family)